jgi:Ni/Fe-hydrogenase subunit HybB-like protein
LGRTLIPVFVFYLVLRVGDLAWRDQLGALLALDKYSVMVLLELTLFAAAPVMVWSDSQRRSVPNLFRAAAVLILAGSLYRIDTFLVAFDPGPQWSYFPSVGETLVTVGLVALEILGYIVLVKYFPILTAQAKPVTTLPD